MEIQNGLVFKWKYVTTIVEWKQHFLKSEAQQKYGFQFNKDHHSISRSNA